MNSQVSPDLSRSLRLENYFKSIGTSGKLERDPYCVGCAIEVAEDTPFTFDVLTDAQQWKRIVLPLCVGCFILTRKPEHQTLNFHKRIHQAANRKLERGESVVNFKLIE